MHKRTVGAHLSSGDKRATPRYTTSESAARLGWRVGDSYQTLNVQLSNVSMGGLAVTASAAPPTASTLWVILNSGPDEDWVEVSLVSVRRGRVLCFPRRHYNIRLKFKESCTFDFFKRAIRGFARTYESEGPASEDVTWFNSQTWR